MMQTRIVIVLVAWALANFGPVMKALADGKIFSRADAIVAIPDQEALIHFADGVETLVIETRFVPPPNPSSGTEQSEDAPSYAWVVPVPGPAAAGGGVPEVFATTTGVFPTLRAVCAPRVTHDVTFVTLPLVVIAILILAIALAEGSTLAKASAAVIIGIIVVGVMMPALGKARGRAPGTESVAILNRTIVGSFDVAIVGAGAADSGADLLSWLNREGFTVPAESGTVIADYARRGWVFVGAKLRQANVGERLTPHPLGVRFKTDSPVYPMRLTGVGNAELALDLYVFGRARAVVEGMRTDRCGWIQISGPSASPERGPPNTAPDALVPVGHRHIQSIIRDADIVTKLTGRFTPDQMRRDIEITWAEPRAIGGRKYSADGASMVAVNAAAGVWFAAIVVLTVLCAIRRESGRKLVVRGIVALAPCLLVALVIRAMLPTTDVSVTRGRRFGASSERLLREAVWDWKRSRENHGGLEDARARLDLAIKDSVARSSWRANTAIPRHEDSPGNYILREVDGGSDFEVIWFDETGREQPVY
jgi:hypothetical protein